MLLINVISAHGAKWKILFCCILKGPQGISGVRGLRGVKGDQVRSTYCTLYQLCHECYCENSFSIEQKAETVYLQSWTKQLTKLTLPSVFTSEQTDSHISTLPPRLNVVFWVINSFTAIST